MASRTQRARQVASYIGAGIIPGQGDGVPIPPDGFVLIIDNDGAYLVDSDGAFLMEAI